MVLNTLNSFDIYNETDLKLDDEIEKIKEVVTDTLKMEKVKDAEFNIILVDNKKIKDINKEYRNIDKETDVISFALEDIENDVKLDQRLLGDIYISVDKAKEQSNEYGHSLIRELCFLSVHGLLHLLGYDHETLEDEKIMFKKQELILDGKRL